MPASAAPAVFLWRVQNPHDVQSAFDETGRPVVEFYSRRAVRGIARGDVIVPVLTQATDYGKKVAVPGLWGARRVEIDDTGRTRVQGVLLVFQGDHVLWTDDLREEVGRRVQAPVRASDDQLGCLVGAGALVDEARKLVGRWV